MREYVDVDLPPHELAHRLTMAGVEVGEVTELGGWENCCVGEVLEVNPHPNADSLQLCRVNPGDGSEMEVVCGAPNVAAGQRICFARVGAHLFNTHSGRHETLKAARIRGVVSEGMICSELELGLGDAHEGIVVLPQDAPLGMALDDYLGDTILDLEITPNRLDCFSILGVAHEIGAITGKKVRVPEVSYSEDGPPITDEAMVSVADPDLCPRYTASLIQGLKIGPSPQWLQDRLTRAGLRPISNVVDVTNYVMLEFNQPLHAFDLDKVRDKTIIVRRATPGETLETLDGLPRELNAEVLVIADSHDPVGLGGVIGGANSEIGPETTSVLLESANFNSFNNRRTADTFRLHTDASQRFEKGLRPELAPIALRRATQLIQQVAGGVIAQGIYDIYADADKPRPKVTLTLRRLKQILGMEVSIDQVEEVFHSLEFRTERVGDSLLEVDVPYWRSDVNIEEDLIEEVVRIIGYDNVPTTMLSAPIPHQQPAPMTGLRMRVKEALAAAGLQETISYPLVSLEDLERVHCVSESLLPLKVTNPMSAGHEYLRPTLLASVLGTLSYNEGYNEGPFRFFEQGRVFLPRPDQLPDEREVAAGAVAGFRSEPSWLVDNGPLDYFDVKGMLTSALAYLGLAPAWEPADAADAPALHPGRCARIMYNGSQIGVLGELHPTVVDNFDLKHRPVSVFELYLDNLLALPGGPDRTGRNFRSLTRYPSANRDIALVVADDVPSGKVQEILERHRLVERVELFDVYAGENLEPGTKSLAFRINFQSPDRTLTAEEVNRTLEGLLRTLQRETGATLRDQ